MRNPNSIAPVGAVPAVAPVQRRKSGEQSGNAPDDLHRSGQEPEEKNRNADDSNKEGGLNRYA